MSELFEQAKAHIHRSEWEPAIALLSRHLNTNFDDDIALWSLASCLIETGRQGIAAALLHQALAVRKQKGGGIFTDALASLGAAYFTMGDIERAEGLYDAALKHERHEPSRADLFANLGKCCTNTGDPVRALHFLKQAMAIRPDHDGALFSSHFAHLSLGHWREGWTAAETRFLPTVEQTQRRIYRGLPEWDGSHGKTVIVWGEQGIGDEILFASCIPDLVERSAHVIIDCHPRLEALFRRSFQHCTVHGTRKVLSSLEWLDHVEPDCSISIASLPKFFRNRDEDFPGTPYLMADIPGVVVGDSFRPRIGIAWTGGTPKTNQHVRSVPLLALEPVFRAVDADFYSLQYQGDAAREVCEFEEKTGIRIKHYPGWVQCRDYDKTASFVASMQLVITVGTSIHHLSNALGIPTWTLVPIRCGWRYADKGKLWYRSSSRFFRQTGTARDRGEWASAIGEVVDELRSMDEAMREAAE